MQTFTAVRPTRRLLPHDLALLLAPVRAEEPSAPDAYAGRAEGVLLDAEKHVVAFIVRLARRLDVGDARTLVPASAVTVLRGPILSLSWTEDRLRAQPRLDPDLQPEGRIDSAPPVEAPRRPVNPGAVPPGTGGDGGEAAKEGLEGALLGAALGGVAGLILGGPIAAASLAVFFAVGGALGGAIAGAAHETAPPASKTSLPALATERDRRSGGGLGGLEQRLRDADPKTERFVTTTRLTSMTTTDVPLVYPREVAGTG